MELTNTRISHVTGLSNNSSNQYIANCSIAPVRAFQKKSDLTVIMAKGTCDDLQLSPIPLKEWHYLGDLADPEFGFPGKIDLLFGVCVWDAIVHGLPGT